MADRRQRSTVISIRNWPGIRRVFRIPLGLRRVRADVNAELGFHIDGRIDELMSLGMSRVEAELEARRRFGDYTASSRRSSVSIAAHNAGAPWPTGSTRLATICATRFEAGATAGIRRRRHSDADARHRGDDRDLSRGRSHRAASASLSES